MKKLTVILAGFAVVFLALAVVSANYSVSRTQTAIEAIGKVSYDASSRDKLDRAIGYLNALDPNLHLDERISNTETLEEAKLEYVRLAIKTAVVKDQRKAADGYTDEEIAQAVTEAREALDQYCDAGACATLENYSDLLSLEQQYTASDSGQSAQTDTEEQDGETVELC
jgi:hypothetical protein